MNKEEFLHCSNFVSFWGNEERQKKGWALSQTNVFAAFVYFSKLIMSISYFSLIARREKLEGGN